MPQPVPTPPPVHSGLLTPREAAAYLRCSERWLFERTRTGKRAATGDIDCVRLGRKVLYRRDDLDALIAARSTANAAKVAA